MTSIKTTYSMSDRVFKKLARREKSLQAVSLKDLRRRYFAGRVKMTKAQIIYFVMEDQYGTFMMKVYQNVKDERMAPKRP